MKKLLIIAFILCARNVFAQKDTVGLNIPLVNNAVVYEKVYDIPNRPQNLLYSNARVWFAGTHPNGGNIQTTLRDSVISRVAGRAKYAVAVAHKILWSAQSETFTYNFTVQIDCKDNKYRIRIYNIQYGNGAASIEEMIRSLAHSKSLTLGSGYILSKNELKERLQVFNNVAVSLLADANKKMLDNNDF